MFVVTEAEAAAIRAAFEQRGKLSAAVELRRLFPGVTDNVQARECARAIAGWKPLRLGDLSGCRNRRGYVGCADGGLVPKLAQSGQRRSASSRMISPANQ